MKLLVVASALFLALCAQIAFAGTSINLPVPGTVQLTVPSPRPYCYASYATTTGYSYAPVVTGFSVDGNYVQGQVLAWHTCGRSRTIWVCAALTWDLSGNLVSASATDSSTSSYCPNVPLNMPPHTPPQGGSVVGNEFENAGGYVAETIVSEICGSEACYETIYQPTLITP